MVRKISRAYRITRPIRPSPRPYSTPDMLPDLSVHPGPRVLRLSKRPPGRMEERFVSTLTEAELRYCEEELGETPAGREAAVEEVRQWLLEEPRLNAKTDSFNILRFLRACKYDMERTKKKIRCFYTMKRKTPQWFQDRDPAIPQIRQLLDIGVFLPLLEPDEEGRLVILIRVAAYDPKMNSMDNLFKAGIMVLDWVLEASEETSVYGVVPVLDLNGISYPHSRQMSVNMIKTAVHSWQDCYPVRVKSMEFINAPVYIEVVLKIFRSFMSQKLKDRVHVHGSDLNSLHNIIPKRILPAEYGGTSGTIKSLADFWKDKVTSEALWYVNDEKHKADL